MNCRTQTKAPHNGTQSSIDGAKAAEAKLSEQKKYIVLTVGQAGGHGMSNIEIANATNIPINEVCARRNELVSDGKLKIADFKDKRAGSKVSSQIVVTPEHYTPSLPF